MVMVVCDPAMLSPGLVWTGMRDWMLKVGDHLGGSAREIRLIDIAQVFLRNEKAGLKIDLTRIIRDLNLAITLTENHLWPMMDLLM